MPTIITRGLGYDEPTIIKRDIGDRLLATVVVEDRIIGAISMDDDIPVGQVSEPIPVVGSVVVEDVLFGSVISTQQIIGVLTEEGPCMTTESNRVTMYLRDDRTLSVAVNYESTGDPVDLTGSKLWFTVKTKTTDADTEALIMKRNTLAGGGDTEFKILDATGGLAEVYLVPADTEEMDPGIYTYDIQTILANGKTYTIVRGRISFKEDVTKATS